MLYQIYALIKRRHKDTRQSRRVRARRTRRFTDRVNLNWWGKFLYYTGSARPTENKMLIRCLHPLGWLAITGMFLGAILIAAFQRNTIAPDIWRGAMDDTCLW